MRVATISLAIAIVALAIAVSGPLLRTDRVANDSPGLGIVVALPYLVAAVAVLIAVLALILKVARSSRGRDG